MHATVRGQHMVLVQPVIWTGAVAGADVTTATNAVPRTVSKSINPLSFRAYVYCAFLFISTTENPNIFVAILIPTDPPAARQSSLPDPSLSILRESHKALVACNIPDDIYIPRTDDMWRK